MKIQIWSDIMCPFCYIGKKNFENALVNLPFRDEIEIEWKSFQLDPTLSETSGKFTTKQYLMEKKGFSEAQYNQMQDRLNQMGEGVGIDFSQASPIAANTLKAHKLLHLAKQFDKQNEMKELLLKAHFENGLNMADDSVLIDLAEKNGIDSKIALQALNDDTIAYEVQQDILEAQNIGVTGVPFFVLNNKYAVSGAQPSEVFADAIRQAFSEIEKLNNISEANSCSIDGCE